MNHSKPNRQDCPESIVIHGHRCERTNDTGDAYYRCDCWPFTIRIACRTVGWSWSVEGLGTRYAAMVGHSGDVASDLDDARNAALIAAGDAVRKLLAFTEYPRVD